MHWNAGSSSATMNCFRPFPRAWNESVIDACFGAQEVTGLRTHRTELEAKGSYGGRMLSLNRDWLHDEHVRPPNVRSRLDVEESYPPGWG